MNHKDVNKLSVVLVAIAALAAPQTLQAQQVCQDALPGQVYQQIPQQAYQQVPQQTFQQIPQQVYQQVSHPTSAVASQNVDPKNKVSAILKSFESGDMSAIESFVSAENFKQHGVMLADGKQGLKTFVSSLTRPGTTVEIKRIFQDGDYVVAHSEYNIDGPKVVFDVFRFENGKVVEHWINPQAAAPANPSGHTLIDGQTEVVDLEKTEANKAMVGKFFDEVLLKGDFSNTPSYFDGNNYLQHNPLIADGLSNLFAFVEKLVESGTPIKVNKIHKVLGQGNFVLVLSDGAIGTQSVSFFDLFRVENGKIAEHWDTIEPKANAKDWKHTNGKF